MRRSAKQLVRLLAAEGLTFRQVSVQQEGQYSVRDADWNYKDIPHLNVVHGGIVRAVIADVNEDHVTSVNVQRVFRVGVPLTLFNYSVTPKTQVYFTTFLVWVLVVETTLEDLDTEGTRVTTTFHVGSSRPFTIFFPLISAVLRRNNRLLMYGDLPMRERRGELRRRGFRFAGDETGYGFESTMPLWPTHVIPPPVERSRVVVDDIVNRSSGRPCFVGADDHVGMRVEQVGGDLLVFPRICMHEGASLDQSPCVGSGQLRCPWHAKRIDPLARFELGSSERQATTTGNHEVILEGGRLTISSFPSS